MRILALLKKDLRPRAIATLEAFKNVIAVDMALGCSTNTVLHIPAIAHEAEIRLNIDLFNTISEKIPNICHLSPAGPHHIEDLDMAGGVGGVMKEISPLGVIHLSPLTVTGKTVGDNLKKSRVVNHDVIRPLADPYCREGGITILRENLAPGGVVVKQSAVSQNMLVNEGPARVFEREDEAMAAILGGKINPGDILVIRYEGPIEGPGMREMLAPTSAIVGMGLDDRTALLTDGRFSGGTKGAAIGHISPEAAEGGPIALIRKGDRIAIDIPHKKLTLMVSEEELARRKKSFQPRPPTITSGYLTRYARLVTSAGTDAIFKDK